MRQKLIFGVAPSILNSQFSILNFSSTEWCGPEARKALDNHPLTISLKYRNINLLSIGYAFQPGLRTD